MSRQRDARLIEGDVGVRGDPGHVADAQIPLTGAAALVDLIASASGSSPTFSSPMSANRFLRPGVTTRAAAEISRVAAHMDGEGLLGVLDERGLDPGAHVHSVCAQSLGDDLAGLRLFGRQQLVGHLEQRDLGAEPCPDLGELYTDRATSEDDDRLRQAVHRTTSRLVS